tara:strand:- start:9702 stop:10082 length:381 start_codon:yes stop_codon:yes gene_type:complete
MRIKDIVKEGTFDDFDMKDYGKDLDDDDKDIGKGFKGDPMFDQLGKIIDSRTSPNPVTFVTTDDGEKIQVNPMQAQELRKLLRYEGMKPQIKLKFTKDVQMSKNLHDFVDSKDYKQIGAVFMQKYM